MTSVYKLGDSGPEVAELQENTNEVLEKAGQPTVTVDREFGPETEDGVKRAQAITGTNPDGKYGHLTRTAYTLYLALGNRRSVSRPTGPVGIAETVVLRTHVPRQGIRVHESIATPVRQLLDDAHRDGIDLAGWGWRDHENQKRLRRQNCGPTRGYDPGDYTVRSSSCRPPTATPGKSMHERGLAVDFTHNGKTIKSRRSQAFKWLKANASQYGLKNLPSEPWHWSTNGR